MLLPLLTVVAVSLDPTTYSGRDGQILVAPPRLDGAVEIDGVLNESQWAQSARLTGFSQYTPSDGRPAQDSTEVLVWYSATAIHFGIRAFERHGVVSATLAERDRITAGDYLELLLGTFNDGRQAMVFAVSPLGVQADGILVETGATAGGFTGATVARERPDLSPDFVFASAGRITDYGYEVEVRIPFKSLRYQPAAEQTWGLNVVRYLFRW
ncbi:MAG: carbohydrate binding family 9 domain-containing protein [Gemmatimonadaceae bacterium]